MSDSTDFSEIDCDHVLSGSEARVLMRKKVTKEFEKLDSRQQSRLMSNMKLWADGRNPSQEQFNGNEGRCGGANNRMLVAVKVHKVRLYGFVRQYRERKTLILVDIDPAKKSNKASPHLLKRARAAAVEVDAICGD